LHKEMKNKSYENIKTHNKDIIDSTS